MSQDLLHQVQAAGVSVWLDGVTRAQLRSGEVAGLVRDLGVSGVTTNPTLLATSLADASAYASDLVDLSARRIRPGEAARLLAAKDVRLACDILLPTFVRTQGVDGWVSFEVDPRFANDPEATLAEVRGLSWLVDRPNLMVKIPATSAGVAAIAAATAEGHSINATLIFSPERYRQVLGAYASGLDRARADGLDISAIHSVASVFVSRVDVALARSSAQPTVHEAEAATRARPLSAFTSPGVANARQIYRSYQGAMAAVAWRELVNAGANPQRPLWASTGVKDPAIEPTIYVAGLAIPGTVNTMPLKTLRAAAEAPGQALRDGSDPLDTMHPVGRLEGLGVVGEGLMADLLEDGITKFQDSWSSVLDILDELLVPPLLRRSGSHNRSSVEAEVLTSVDP